MASLRRKERGSWLARWRNADGDLVEEATGEYSREKAQRKANQMEAEARFWEDVDQFRTYAALGYSPRYCHDSFIAAKHLRFDRFRALLKDAGIEFKKASEWRDIKRKPGRGKKFRYRGRSLTLPQIIEVSGCGLNITTVRFRLSKGWSVENAVNTPLIDRRVSGRQGAEVTNSRRRG